MTNIFQTRILHIQESDIESADHLIKRLKSITIRINHMLVGLFRICSFCLIEKVYQTNKLKLKFKFDDINKLITSTREYHAHLCRLFLLSFSYQRVRSVLWRLVHVSSHLKLLPNLTFANCNFTLSLSFVSFRWQDTVSNPLLSFKIYVWVDEMRWLVIKWSGKNSLILYVGVSLLMK